MIWHKLNKNNKEFIVNVKDDAIFAEALAMVDSFILTHPDKSHFIEHKENSFIRCYLQLFWNPQENNIYSDINLFAGSVRGIMPIESNMNFNLYPDCEISMTSDAWGWWAKMADRLDYGRFKTVIRKIYGKNKSEFTHYFQTKN